MTLTTIAKPLRIMREPYYEKEQVNHSLMSPPLTPTEAHHPTTVHHDWYYPTNKRKEFITSYSRMVPYLKTSENNGVFALNVYRDILLKQQDKGNHNKINKDNKKNQDCVMLDETVVPLSRKRTFCSDEEEENSEEEEDKTMKKVYKKKKRVSSILPTGKEAALAFDAIDIDSNDQDFYPSGWVPFRGALDQVPVKVCWKGNK